MNQDEILLALEAVPYNSTHQLMVGLLASEKSVRGMPMKDRWARQTPSLGNIKHILLNDQRVLNLVHYSCDDESVLVEDLIQICTVAGEILHGFQLNIAWPEPSMLELFHERSEGKFDRLYRIVLQLGSQAVRDMNPFQVAERLWDYEDLIDDVLYDPSGGMGQGFRSDKALLYLNEIAAQHKFGLGVAGGLSFETLGQIRPIVDYIPHLSIDAQGRLRDADHNLDNEAVRNYLARAYSMLA